MSKPTTYGIKLFEYAKRSNVSQQAIYNFNRISNYICRRCLHALSLKVGRKELSFVNLYTSADDGQYIT